MWNRFKSWFFRFMSGRYGADALGQALLWVYLLLFLLGTITRLWPVSLLASLLAVYMLFRMFSRNRMARIRENQAYLRLKNKWKGSFSLAKDKWRDRKTHVYRTSPKCKAVLRQPKRAGEHGVRSPRCGEHFRVKGK